jgi:AraC family transcriptional regulator, arabinose operon regulatory protein
MKVVVKLTLQAIDTKNELQSQYELNQLYFRVHRIDENIRSADWHIDKVDRPYSVFWYVLSGKKTIFINDVKYVVQKGDFVVFPSQTSFKIVESNHTTSMHHLEIAVENKLGPFNLMTLYSFPTVTNLTDSANEMPIINLWRRLIDEWTPNIRNPFSPNNGELKFGLDQTIELLRFNARTIDWFVEVLTLLRPRAAELFPTFDSRLQHLFTFIEKNIATKLSLKKLADEVFLSESHLSLLFRQNVKMAPMEYVRNIRLQKVREFLLTTNLSLKEISDKIGFDDQSQLSRAFRRATGMSPTEYRQMGDFI